MPATKTKNFKKVSNEPKQLVRGKIFHKLIQNDWIKTAKEGKPNPEKYIKKVDGKKGRVDILIDELGKDYVSIVEIKASDWDKMTEKNAKRNIKRQIRQIWGYIDSQLEVYKMEVCPGVIFPKTPKNIERQNLVESMFNEEGIQVVWHE